MSYYNYQWATKRYEAFACDYEDSIKVLTKIYGDRKASYIRFLACKNTQFRWENFKKAVKYISKSYYLVEQWCNYDEKEIIKYYRKLLSEKFLKNHAKVLDKPVQLMLR